MTAAENLATYLRNLEPIGRETYLSTIHDEDRPLYDEVQQLLSKMSAQPIAAESPVIASFCLNSIASINDAIDTVITHKPEMLTQMFMERVGSDIMTKRVDRLRDAYLAGCRCLERLSILPAEHSQRNELDAELQQINAAIFAAVSKGDFAPLTQWEVGQTSRKDNHNA